MSTYSEQPLLHSNQFDTKVIFWCCFFFREISSFEKLLLEQSLLFSGHFFRIVTSFSEKLLTHSYFLRTANRQFLRAVTFSQDKNDQNKDHISYFFQKTTPKEVLFYNSYFLKTANFSEKEYFRVLNFSGDPLFQNGYFLEKLLFDSRCFLTAYSFRRDTSYHLFSTATLLIYQLVIM